MIGLSLTLLSSGLEHRAEHRQRVEQHADDVRRAADRVAILDARPRDRGGAGAVFEVVAHPAPRTWPSPGAA